MKKIQSKLIAKICLLALGSNLLACGGNNKQKEEIEQIKVETIAVHDEIMPEVATFDRYGIKIDTILLRIDSLYQVNPDLDTAALKQDLLTLKGKLESATDQMMRWMMDFEGDRKGAPDSVKTYFEKELEKIKKMRNVFEEVKKESETKLADF